jgi:hypothetical protein
MTLAPRSATGLVGYRQVGWIPTADETLMGYLRRHSEALAPVADYAAEGLDRMRGIDFLQTIMTGEASFHPAGNHRPQFFHPQRRLAYGCHFGP